MRDRPFVLLVVSALLGCQPTAGADRELTRSFTPVWSIGGAAVKRHPTDRAVSVETRVASSVPRCSRRRR